jgi:hypothetical protein
VVARPGPPTPPDTDDSIFSPIGQWLAEVMDDIVRKGLWLLYALFAALVVAALELRRRLSGKKKKPARAKP